MRQGNDRRSAGLASQALLPARVNCAAANAAVLGGCLLDRSLTSRTSADLERSGLFRKTVSDLHCSLQLSRSLPWPVSPDALLIMLAALTLSSIGFAYPHSLGRERISWG